MSTTIDIYLKRASKIYHQGEAVIGVISVSSPNDVKHDGLIVSLEGNIELQATGRPVGLLDAFSSQAKPITLIGQSIELAPAGKIPAGLTEFPFEIPLRGRNSQYPNLLETYHGVFISVIYMLKCTMKRSFLNKPIGTSCQIVLQYPQSEPPEPRPVRCSITPESVRASDRRHVPRFHIDVALDSAVCALDRPLTGEVCVRECSVPIKSIELQLVRVETVGTPEGFSRDATEIQNVQLGDGDVCRGISVPLYMVLPRLFTCPTTSGDCLKIEFEVNLAIIFQDDHLITENFPILLVRSR